MKEKLRYAGLTENESKVYLALLENGPSHAGLISRKSGLHRRVVYDTLEMLIKKGLIGYILRNNVKLFQASNPERVLELVKEKEQHLQEIMPSLMQMYGQTREKEETNFYKGMNGLKTVFEDMISEGKEILVLGASPVAYELMQFYFEWFDKRRKKAGIREKIIFNSDVPVNVPYAEVRYLSKEYHSPLAVNIYGDKTAIILWSRKNPFSIVIKNEEVSIGYRKYFDLLWKLAKPRKI